MRFPAGFFSVAGWRAFQKRKPVRIVLKVVQALVVLGVLTYLIVRVGEIGWAEVWRSLPESPWFYIIFIAIYLAWPVTELVAFERIWKVGLWRCLPVFIRKRVYNYAVVSYSGEAYLALWARRHLPLENRQVLSTIKDNNVLSSLASNGFTLLLLIVFMAFGQLTAVLRADPELGVYFAVAGVAVAVITTLIVRFRDRILAVPPKVARPVLAIHVGRNILLLALQTAQWAVVFPQVPLSTWLMFLTAQLVLTRLPFLPNQDLLLVGLSMSIMVYIDAPEAAVAGMFLASGALFQIVNVVMYALTSIGAHAPRAASVDTSPQPGE